MNEDRIEALEKRCQDLEKQVRNLQDIEEIKTLQKAYGYYLEHWMSKEVIDLFSDDSDVTLTLAAGTYLGKERVRGYFSHVKPTQEFLHQVMQLSGIVTVSDDGKKAKGRWYGWGAVAMPSDKLVRQSFFGGIYECEYIKETGIWKIQKLRFDQVYSATPKDGWVKPELVAPRNPQNLGPNFKADIPRSTASRYPSGYILPFSFKHPVTGEETSEGEWNMALGDKQ
jgi:hypothetical protein